MALIKHSILLLSLMLVFILFIKSSSTGKDMHASKSEKVEIMKKKQKILFLITEDPNNYEAHKTVPQFAKMLRKKYRYDVTVLLGSGDRGSYRFPNMELVSKADLLIVFARRIALPHEQMNIIKSYLAEGKPLIGIRTANHAFTYAFAANDKIGEGFEDWPGFVDDILGCKNRGYGPVEPGTDVSIISKEINHPILKGIHPQQWHSDGNVYLVAPLLDKEATVLLTGKANAIIEPIAWTRTAGKSKVFYTSLGFPTDFQRPQFITLLVNAIKWTLLKDHNL